MLQTENGGRNQHSYLFTVANGFKSGSDGYFRFSETHITTDKPVHRTGIFHIPFDRANRFILIGSIFIHKGRFQLFLQVIVGRKGETGRSLSFGIETNQILGYILHFILRRNFCSRPGLASQFMNMRSLTVLGFIARNFVKGMNGNKNYIVVFIFQFHHIMHAAFIVRNLDQSSENPHSIIYMNNIISYRKTG